MEHARRRASLIHPNSHGLIYPHPPVCACFYPQMANNGSEFTEKISSRLTSHLDNVLIYIALVGSVQFCTETIRLKWFCLIGEDRSLERHGNEITGYKLVDGKITGVHVGLKDVSREPS